MSFSYSITPVQWQFRWPFRIAHGTRTHTDAVVLELNYEGFAAYGEATLPPYLPDTQKSTIDFLENLDWNFLQEPIDPSNIFRKLDAAVPGFLPAKAALDMALWDLKAQIENTPVPELLGIIKKTEPLRSFTLGVCDRAEMSERLAFAVEHGFNFFKLKFDGRNDRPMLEDFLSFGKEKFAVDVNQAWTDVNAAIHFGKELVSVGCLLIEQPFHKDDTVFSRYLKGEISIPVVADEACQRLPDVPRLANSFSGINVKLQKCGGISQAYEMIKLARALDLKVLIGCMSESSIGCNAAENLSPLCNWNDLDGPYLIK